MLCPGPIGITEHEARDFARRLTRGEPPIPLVIGGETLGVMRLYPFAPDVTGPTSHWLLCLDDSAHGSVRLAIFGPGEVE